MLWGWGGGMETWKSIKADALNSASNANVIANGTEIGNAAHLDRALVFDRHSLGQSGHIASSCICSEGFLIRCQFGHIGPGEIGLNPL